MQTKGSIESALMLVICLLLAAARTLRTCYKQAQTRLLRVTWRRTKVPQLKAFQPLAGE